MVTKETDKKETAKKETVKKKKMVFVTGKRKRAVARARFKEGTGRVKINSIPIDNITSEMLRLRIQEPLIIAGDSWKKFDININVRGGGTAGQSEAARQTIARGLVQLLGAELKKRYLEYDRNLLVYDPRRTEPHKPPRSSQGPRRYKQRSKR
jgi:small subunit ribosomal protein S9